MSKQLASLSIDLDNQWSYMKTGALPGWQDFPSYFDIAVPRMLDILKKHDLVTTVFIVGQDAELPRNGANLRSIASAGHEVGNHSFHHEPWLNRQGEPAIIDELRRAHEAIADATGAEPTGFRGPGFSLSNAVLTSLVKLGYAYDASTFPTYIGPLARSYYFLKSNFSKTDQETRGHLFGSLRDGLRPLKPYLWDMPGDLIEMPVTTIPGIRAPFHFTYLSFLAGRSPALAITYFRSALTACKLAGIEPSFLLHPLDFLGTDDIGSLGNFPGMTLSARDKLKLVDDVLGFYAKSFRVLPMGAHASIARSRRLWKLTPVFDVDTAAPLPAQKTEQSLRDVSPS